MEKREFVVKMLFEQEKNWRKMKDKIENTKGKPTFSFKNGLWQQQNCSIEEICSISFIESIHVK